MVRSRHDGVGVNSHNCVSIDFNFHYAIGISRRKCLELWQIGLEGEVSELVVLPEIDFQFILANQIPGDGKQPSDWLVEPKDLVNGAPCVNLQLTKPLLVQSDQKVEV